MSAYGANVMLAYGGGSVKKNGIYDEVKSILEGAGKKVTDFSGIMSNPTYAKVQEGAKLAESEHIDFILAVGGGYVIDCCKIVAAQARGNLMWDSAMAENGILKAGRVTDFQCHQMEHQLGAYTDCNHGQGLAVIHPAYYRHIVKDAEEKFAKFGREVFGVDTAEKAVEALADFIRECGLPTKMSELRSKAEITPELLRNVADTCNIIRTDPRELTHDEIYDILMECM